MGGLAPEVGEEVFGGLPGQFQIDSIGTQLDFIIPSDLPAGADVDLGKELLILPRLEDALPRQLRQVYGAFRAIRKYDLDPQVRQRAYRNRFHHSLALPSHLALLYQTKEESRVIVHVDTEQAHDQLVNSRLAYGSVSRLRYDAQIYCNAAEKLGEELTRAVSKSGALEAEHETNGRERDHSAECGARNGSWNHFYSSNRPTTTPKSQGFTLRQPALIKFGRNYFPYFVG